MQLTCRYLANLCALQENHKQIIMWLALQNPSMFVLISILRSTILKYKKLNSLILGQYRYGGEWEGHRVGWVVATAKIKKWDDGNGRVQSGQYVHMYSQWANIPLQGLDGHALTIEAISSPHCWFRAYHWHYFTSCEYTWLAKTPRKSRPVDISQWRQWPCIVIFSVAISWAIKWTLWILTEPVTYMNHLLPLLKPLIGTASIKQGLFSCITSHMHACRFYSVIMLIPKYVNLNFEMVPPSWLFIWNMCMSSMMCCVRKKCWRNVHKSGSSDFWGCDPVWNHGPTRAEQRGDR